MTHGETFAATKTEAGASFPAAAYAYTPDPDMPSTWKLRLWATPDGGPDARIVGAAIAALGKGFRGNKVEIPADDLSAVKTKVKAAWVKANPDKKESDMPSFSVEGVTMGDKLRRERRDELALRTFSLTEKEVPWQGPITFEDEKTGDNRLFESGSVRWDENTLPFPFRRVEQDQGGHKSAAQIGRVDKIWRNGNAIMASGVIFASLPEAAKYLELLKLGAIGGVSIDADDPKFYEIRTGPASDQIRQVKSPNEPDQHILQRFTQIRIRGLTAVDIPAFNNAKISLISSDKESSKMEKDSVEAGARWYSEEQPTTAGARWYTNHAPIEEGARWYSTSWWAGEPPRNAGARWYTEDPPIQAGARWYTTSKPTEQKATWEPVVEGGARWYSSKDKEEFGARWYDSEETTGSNKYGARWYSDEKPTEENVEGGARWYGARWYADDQPVEAGARWYSSTAPVQEGARWYVSEKPIQEGARWYNADEVSATGSHFSVKNSNTRSGYSEKLRRERREELALRALSDSILDGEEVELGLGRFLEKLHPRGKDGRFAKSEGSSTGSYVSKSGEIHDVEYDKNFKKEDYEEALRDRKQYLEHESKLLTDQMTEISKKRMSLDPNDKKGLKKLDAQYKALSDKRNIFGTEMANLPSKDQHPLSSQKFYNPKTFKPSRKSAPKPSSSGQRQKAF